MQRLHVTGCRRSGTTLLFEMLVACYTHAGHSEHEESVFANPVPVSDGLYISKKPSDITHIRHILERDPALHVIYMLRDPRAVVTSIHPSRGTTYFASFERWQRYERAARPLKSHPRFVEVRYERLVAQPDTIQAELEARLPFLERQHSFSAFHRHAHTSKRAEISLRGLRPVSINNIATWHDHLPRVKFQLEKYPQMRRALVEQGYEVDDAWEQKLDGIQSQPQDYGEDLAPPWQRLETTLRYYLKSRHYLAARNRQAKKRRPKAP